MALASTGSTGICAQSEALATTNVNMKSREMRNRLEPAAALPESAVSLNRNIMCVSTCIDDDESGSAWAVTADADEIESPSR
jgi:hypothetical protein